MPAELLIADQSSSKFCRAFRSAGLVLLSALLGLVGSRLVWGFIYSIGSSAITDGLYYKLQGVVLLWGMVISLPTGLIVSLNSGPKAVLTLVASHSAAIFAGMIGGTQGWASGLAGYFGVHAFLVIGGTVKVGLHHRNP